MTKFNQNNTGIRVCIDAVRDGRLFGRVFSQMLTAPMPFADAAQLVLQLEALLDAVNFPQAFQRGRAFQSARRGAPLAAESPEAGMSTQEVAAAAGELATAAVRVISRRSSSWQGSINWGDGGPAEPFSSALEFMRLLDARMQGV